MTKKLSLVEIEYICNMFFQSFEIPVCFLDSVYTTMEYLLN